MSSMDGWIDHVVRRLAQLLAAISDAFLRSSHCEAKRSRREREGRNAVSGGRKPRRLSACLVPRPELNPRPAIESPASGMIVSSTQGPAGAHHGAGRAGDLIPFHACFPLLPPG